MSLDILTTAASHSATQSQHNKPRRSLAWLLPCGLLVGFVLILAILFGERLIPAQQVQVSQAITLRSDDASLPVSTASDQMLFQASGWIEPDPYITYVPTLINGVVESIEALEGDIVKKGQEIARLINDDQTLALNAARQQLVSHKRNISAHCEGIPILNAQIDAARKNIAAQQAMLDLEKDNLKRVEELGGDAVSVQTIVKTRFAVTRHMALVAQAEAQVPELEGKIKQLDAERESMEAKLDELQTKVSQAQLALDRTIITAPIDGVVLHLHAVPGKKRMLNMDDPKSAVLVELYDPQKLQARIDVPLNEAAGLQIGQAVELVSDFLPNTTFRGSVTRINGQADLQRNTLQVKVAIHNPDIRLRPDMLVRAKFYAPETNASTTNPAAPHTGTKLAIYLPSKALINDAQVWIVGSKHRAELRDITLGNSTRDDHIQATSGVRSGELVVLPPHSHLSVGDKLSFTTQF
ncbi:efflux RND transporter periplasmic adaptor subunit [Rubritalea marina]|uniref:efflux RND transporter periplasmic adaptor subunit n=1 Tax=Rubritalea marina TaxID=361055 RepID=UPI000360FA16|nr:efflux RND transporter periplasmic adaptor subunit [Rubritalea marina]